MQLRTLLSLGLVAFATAQYSSTSKTSSVSALSSTTASSQSRVSASAAAGQTLRVNVSNANAGLFYSPNVITAAKGAKVEFHYNPKNHSVVQSSFGAPCQPLAGGVNSGFVPSAAGESPTVFTVTVNDTTTPIWLYCAQTAGNHCQNGMSMVINQQPGPNTLQAYQAASKNTTTKAGSSISGGVFSTNSNTTRSSSTSSGPYSGSSTPTRPSPGLSSPGSRGNRTTPGSPRYTGGATAVDIGSALVFGATAGMMGFLL